MEAIFQLQINGKTVRDACTVLLDGTPQRSCTSPVSAADGPNLTDLLSKYRVPRFEDVPPLETVLLDRKDLPSAGAGETPIVAVAPAIANAVFAASGVRLRSLPLTLPG